MQSKIQTGTCKAWHGSYGFILEDGGDSLFVHQSQLDMPGYRELLFGQRVTFEVEQGDRGPIAICVKLIEE